MNIIGINSNYNVARIASFEGKKETNGNKNRYIRPVIVTTVAVAAGFGLGYYFKKADIYSKIKTFLNKQLAKMPKESTQALKNKIKTNKEKIDNADDIVKGAAVVIAGAGAIVAASEANKDQESDLDVMQKEVDECFKGKNNTPCDPESKSDDVDALIEYFKGMGMQTHTQTHDNKPAQTLTLETQKQSDKYELFQDHDFFSDDFKDDYSELEKRLWQIQQEEEGCYVGDINLDFSGDSAIYAATEPVIIKTGKRGYVKRFFVRATTLSNMLFERALINDEYKDDKLTKRTIMDLGQRIWQVDDYENKTMFTVSHISDNQTFYNFNKGKIEELAIDPKTDKYVVVAVADCKKGKVRITTKGYMLGVGKEKFELFNHMYDAMGIYENSKYRFNG